MKPKREPAIARLVAHQGGPTELSRKLGGTPAYQEIQRWLKRGWASPMHILKLEPLMPQGMTVRDLYFDRAGVEAPPAKTPRKRAKPEASPVAKTERRSIGSVGSEARHTALGDVSIGNRKKD